MSKKSKKAKLAERVSEINKSKKAAAVKKAAVKVPTKQFPLAVPPVKDKPIVGVGAGRTVLGAGLPAAMALRGGGDVKVTLLPVAPAVPLNGMLGAGLGAPAVPPATTVPVKSQMSGLDAAAKVLGDVPQSLNCPAIVAAIFAKGYWQSNGKTPAATLHTAIISEIKKKGDKSRFVQTGRGLFSVRK